MTRRVARVMSASVWLLFAAALVLDAGTTDEAPRPEVRAAQPQHATFDAALAARWPDCIAQDRYRGPDHFIPTRVLVQDFRPPYGDVRPMRFDRAWAKNHTNPTTDDLWVVASCRGDAR